MARCRGEIRRCMSAAVWRAMQRGLVITFRTLAELAGVGWRAAQRTVEEMVRAGELVPVGRLHTGRRGRPMTTFAPAAYAAGYAAQQQLAGVLARWCCEGGAVAQAVEG